ncbi:ABC transporter permease [Lactobacillaceae bacterium Scapto_B20]
MIDLFKQRLSAHLTEVVKYLRYVFNDFFVIALMFLIGGLGLSYSNLLKQLHSGIWWTGIVALLVLLAVQGFNHLASLIKPADRVFLIPQEVAMHGYLKVSFKYSLLMATLTQMLVWFILLPFMRVTTDWQWGNLIMLLLTMVILKAASLQLTVNRAYVGHRTTMNIKWLVILISLATAVLIMPLIGLIISIIFFVSLLYVHRNWQGRSIDWNYLIEAEDKRMLSLYKFFNLFTDVPEVAGTTKRRRYLDFLVDRIKATPQNIYLYLYGRSIVRNGEYSGLHLRLTLIGAVLLFGVNGLGLSVLISLLFIYLIGFQLMPFYFYFESNVFTHVYPINQQLQLNSFKKIVAILLTTTAIIFAIMTTIGSSSLAIGGICLLLNVVEVWLLINKFIPNRINKKLN